VSGDTQYLITSQFLSKLALCGGNLSFFGGVLHFFLHQKQKPVMASPRMFGEAMLWSHRSVGYPRLEPDILGSDVGNATSEPRGPDKNLTWNWARKSQLWSCLQITSFGCELQFKSHLEQMTSLLRIWGDVLFDWDYIAGWHGNSNMSLFLWHMSIISYNYKVHGRIKYKYLICSG
jgi:hypothetical protein